MSKIENELMEKLTNHVAKHGKKPSVILIKPTTYKKFMVELTKAIAINYSKVTNPKFMDIKIVRSNDVNTIEVY
jgi:hypothetical protein